MFAFGMSWDAFKTCLHVVEQPLGGGLPPCGGAYHVGGVYRGHANCAGRYTQFGGVKPPRHRAATTTTVAVLKNIPFGKESFLSGGLTGKATTPPLRGVNLPHPKKRTYMPPRGGKPPSGHFLCFLQVFQRISKRSLHYIIDSFVSTYRTCK